MDLKDFAETERKEQHQDKPTSEAKAKSESENGNIFNDVFLQMHKEPLEYYERQKQTTIKINNVYNDLKLYENKLIAFSGVPGSAKSRISLSIIQEIINSNSNYNAILFSLELNRNTAVSLLAKTPVFINHDITKDKADNYNEMNKEYKINYLDTERIGIIDRTTKFEETNDINTIESILEAYKQKYYTDVTDKEINTFEDWKNYHNKTVKETKLIIFLDYFDILRTKDIKNEYEKQEYLIDKLKSFRDNYNFVTFIIINSTNKEAFKTDGGNMGSIKGNSSIIFGYDQAFSIENISHNRLKKEQGKKESDILKDHRHKDKIKQFGTIDFISAKLNSTQIYQEKSIYQDEGIIIIEDTKSRYGGAGTHFYKAINGYSEFIPLDKEKKQ